MKQHDILANHLHLPLQSGSDLVLSKMERKYDVKFYVDKINKIREARPDIAISTDIIVGFPNETIEDFNETLDVVNTCKFDGAYTFIFSPRVGTPAAKMADNVTLEEKNKRLYKLNELINKYSKEANDKYLNKIVPVLIEGTSEKDESMLMGYTDTMKLVNVKADKKYIGKIINVKIKEIKTWSMDGEIAE